MNDLSSNLKRLLEKRELNEFTPQEIDDLSPEDLD